MKFSNKLILLVAIFSILLIGVGGVGLYGITKANDSLSSVYASRVVPLEKINEINYLVQRNRVLVMDMTLVPDASNVEERNKELRSNIERITGLWKDYRQTSLSPEEAALADAFAQARKAYVQEGLLGTANAMLEGKRSDALANYREKVSNLAPPTQGAVVKLNQYQLDLAKQEYDAAVGRYKVIFTAAIAAVVAGLILGCGLAFSILKGVLGELGGEPRDAAMVARRVAAGDLTTRIEVKSAGENSIMAALQQMQLNLASVIGSVRENAEGVATASTQIAMGNTDLSQRTEEQASALQQTATTMDHFGTTVSTNADNAKLANQLASSASQVATKGGEVVKQVVDTMKGIDESSKRIAEIIGVIDGIAFQTNILALNAAVEAARAGEQGRGFAVVATEVRSLAGRSADAAKEIKSLIGASVERVEHGTLLVDEAGRTMEEVVHSIQRVTDVVGEISAASTAQNTGVSQIGQAVNQLDQTTQQNAALVEESAAAAQSLDQQARELVAAVSVFKLSHGQSAMVRPAYSPAQDSTRKMGVTANIPAKSNFASLGRDRAAATTPRVQPALGQPISVASRSNADAEWESF
jgi:methyl-accepting chemotaxis protein